MGSTFAKLQKRYRSFGRHPLADGRSFAPFLRYVGYHMRRKLSKSPPIHSWIGGTKLIAFHEAGITGNLFHGLHDFEDMGFVLHALRRDDTFLDVGANCGAYSVLASGVVGAASIAVEPVPHTFERLRAILALNELNERVEAVPAGVGREAGTATFSTDRGAMNRILPDGQTRADSVEIPVRTIDEIVAGRAVRILKIDVEGFEQPALQGASALLAQGDLQAILVELNGSGRAYGYEDEGVHVLLTDAGFRPYAYEPRTRTLTPRETWNREHFNTLYVRAEARSDLAARLQDAPPFQVRGRTF